MPLLSDLPTEVLEYIIEYAIAYTDSAPESPESSGNRAVFKDPECLAYEFGPRNVKFKNFPAGTNANSNTLSLLLASKRLNDITRSVLLHVSHPYELDIMFLDNGEIYPTWTSVPAPGQQHIQDLRVTVRAFASIQGKYYRRLLYQPKEGKTPFLSWPFYYLLERFLKTGPLCEHRDSPNRHMIVHNLTINCISPKDPATVATEKHFRAWVRCYPDEGFNPEGRYRSLDIPSLIRPVWMRFFLTFQTFRLAGMRDHAFKYGQTLHEQIGVICMGIDGQVSDPIKLGQKLPHMDNTVGEYRGKKFHIPEFLEWKRKALDMRRSAGLPVVEGPIQNPAQRRALLKALLRSLDGLVPVYRGW